MNTKPLRASQEPLSDLTRKAIETAAADFEVSLSEPIPEASKALEAPGKQKTACHRCRHWAGTRRGRGWCVRQFPGIRKTAHEYCEQFCARGDE